MASPVERGRPPDREVVALDGDRDLAQVRRRTGAMLDERAPSKLIRVRILTVVSELARNVIVHGGGGVATFWMRDLPDGGTTFYAVLEDQGPGIPDIALAMKDGYSTGKGLGLGLPGSRRIADTFEVVSAPDQGTRITVSFRL